jgi:hypothetical protein
MQMARHGMARHPDDMALLGQAVPISVLDYDVAMRQNAQASTDQALSSSVNAVIMCMRAV